jgi:nucleoside-diphosphate-sugar epimerase
MNFIITGASGLIGRQLCASLWAAGHSGLAVSRQPIDSLPPSWRWKERGSLLAERRIQAVVDAVVHLEVKHHVPFPRAVDYSEFVRVNVEGTEEWLRWCSEREIQRFVYFSSIKAVGSSDLCQDETSDLEPLGPYGESKREGERRVQRWAESGDRSALILRPAVVYGPGTTANIFAIVRAIDCGLFFLAGENANVKSLVALRNVTSAVVHLLPQMAVGCEVYHLVDRSSHSVREIAGIISRLLGRSAPPRTLPLPVMRLAASVGDLLARAGIEVLPISSSRLEALIETTHFSADKLRASGFVHPQTTEEGLAELVQWYRYLHPRR